MTLYGKRWSIECGLRDTKDLRFGMGMSAVHVSTPARRDRLWLLNACAIALLTLLGAAGEALGYDRQCAAASGVRDGGGPPAIGLQEQVANRRKRRGSKARVVSVTEKASERRQVGDRKANTSELPFKCRKCSDDVETGGLCCAGIGLDETCLRARRRPA
jgi:hypothetical protein